MASKKIVIIGAGPTGLGAAYRLHELGYDNWVLYEKSDEVGGHSTSHIDACGFVWDEGGHVIFSHYPYFDNLIEKMLGTEIHERIRESWIVKGTAGSPILSRAISDTCRKRFKSVVCWERPRPRPMEGPRRRELSRLDSGHLWRGHRGGLHVPLQLQGLDHAAGTDVQTLDRRPGRGGGFQTAAGKRSLRA